MQIKEEILGYQYTEDFVSQHQIHGGWNNAQLNLIVETVVNFIDTYAGTFTKNGYPGTAVWIFEELCKINRYVRENGYKEGDRRFKEVAKSLLDYNSHMRDRKQQPQWISNHGFTSLITKPYKLATGFFYELELQQLHKDGYYFSPEKTQQAHDVLDEILKIAIERIKNTPTYQQAEKKGHLFYDPQSAIVVLPSASQKEIGKSRFFLSQFQSDTGVSKQPSKIVSNTQPSLSRTKTGSPH